MWPTSGSNSNQWSFNPAAYQNVPYEQVDWATLAQQWIKMKETIPSVSPGLPPPPAPQISKMNVTQAPKSTAAASEARPSNDIEGGEAPMDMDTKDEDVPALGTATDSNWKQWTDWQSQWGWGWQGNAGTSPLGAKTSSSASTVNSKVKSPSNDSNPVLNNYVSNVGSFPNNSGTTSTPQVPGSFNYNKVAGGTIPPSHPKTGYYSESSYTAAGKPASNRSSNKNSHQKTATEQYLPVMDAAKKKKLPAWIREGLNKMERDKQRKMEHDRMVQERFTRNQLSSEKAFKNDLFSERIESPASSPSVADEDVEPLVDRYQKSRSSSIERGPPRSEKSSGTVEDSNIIRKTKDQIMEESMLKVRRILTEFLLEATENQVATIAKEELRRKRTAPAPQIRKSNALTSLTGNLGLAAYDSDSASTDSERDVDNRETDSDDELTMLIEKKKRNFALIEDKIEEEIQNQESKERQVVQRHQEFENQDGRGSKFQDKDKKNSQEDSNSRSRSHTSEQDGRGDKKASKSNSTPNNHDKPEHPRKNSKSKKRRRSSSSSSSSSESSRSSESDSSSSDRSASKVESSSRDSRHSRKKKDRQSRKKNNFADKDSKRLKRSSKSRSPSRSRYSRDEKRHKNSSNREKESSERKRSSDRHETSDRHHERSSSYRRDSKDSRDSSTSKYREAREREYRDSKHKGRRSRSRDSRRYSRR